jgi:hypothetical protein
MSARGLPGAYRGEMAGVTVRARSARLYLAGHSACEITARIGRTTSAGSITAHLRQAGLGGVHWCAVHRVHEEV